MKRCSDPKSKKYHLDTIYEQPIEIDLDNDISNITT